MKMKSWSPRAPQHSRRRTVEASAAWRASGRALSIARALLVAVYWSDTTSRLRVWCWEVSGLVRSGKVLHGLDLGNAGGLSASPAMEASGRSPAVACESSSRQRSSEAAVLLGRTTTATMANVHRPRVFLDVNIGEQPAGRLTIELFTDKTPKTAEKYEIRQPCVRLPSACVLTEVSTQFSSVVHRRAQWLVVCEGAFP